MTSHTQASRSAPPPWQTLTNWLALLALIALGISWSPAEATAAAEQHAGTLLLKSGADAAPLEALRQVTRMHATVTGNVARVAVTQTFTNQSADWMEGLYVFPLPAESAVDELTMQIGERTIVGEIREREAAHAAYQAARSQGRQASLVDQERPNMFSTSIANIPPGGTITVSIAYLDSVAYRDGRYTLSLPLSITPRYTPGSASDGDSAQAAAVDGGTPERVSAATQNVAIEVNLEPGFALAAVRSLYHPITETPTTSGARIGFSAAEAPADRDFELTWTPQVAPDTQAAAFTERAGDSSYLLLLLTPPQLTSTHLGAREVIFVIDTSGSMEGPSIEQARAALQLGVARLRPIDRFNVIRFSDDATRLFQASQPATSANTAAAGRFIDALQAGGGTEMRRALQLAFASPPTAELLRQIVFITDGSVGNEDELVQLIRTRIGSGRLFTVGIGAAPNAYFMHGAAAAGRGSYTFIGNRQQVQERMTDLFQKLEQPALTDLVVQWPGGAAELAAPLPGDLYAGDPLVLAARLPQVPHGLITLSGSSEGHPWVRQVPLAAVTSQAGIAKLWARQRIAELTAQRSGGADAEALKSAIITLALAHHLVSDFTSLIAVDVTPLRPEEAPYARAQAPTAAPQGSYWANSTGFARTATPAPLLILIGTFSLLLAAVVGVATLRRAGARR